MRAGNLLIALGVALVLVGVGVRLGLFGWFGRLPGDIRSEGERTTVFIPITSMLIVSVVGSIVLNLIARFFRGGS
jgi:Protein of unknown function (DUF2905)